MFILTFCKLVLVNGTTLAFGVVVGALLLVITALMIILLRRKNMKTTRAGRPAIYDLTHYRYIRKMRCERHKLSLLKCKGWVIN